MWTRASSSNTCCRSSKVYRPTGSAIRPGPSVPLPAKHPGGGRIFPRRLGLSAESLTPEGPRRPPSAQGPAPLTPRRLLIASICIREAVRFQARLDFSPDPPYKGREATHEVRGLLPPRATALAGPGGGLPRRPGAGRLRRGARIRRGLAGRAPLLRVRDLPLPGRHGRGRGPAHPAGPDRDRRRDPPLPAPPPDRGGVRHARHPERGAARLRGGTGLPARRVRRLRGPDGGEPDAVRRGARGHQAGLDSGAGHLRGDALPRPRVDGPSPTGSAPPPPRSGSPRSARRPSPGSAGSGSAFCRPPPLPHPG